MPENWGGKYTGYKDDRGRYVGKNKKPGRTQGDVDPKAPSDPSEAKGKGPFCNARRTGKSSSGKGLCCMPAGWGTDHVGTGRCKLHGGNTYSHNMSAARQEAIATVKKLYGEDIDIDPHEALLGEVRRTTGAVIWLQEHIQELEDPEKLKQITNNMGIQPSVWIDMYQKERAHLVRVAKACIDAGIAERQVRLAEGHGRLIAVVIQNFLQDPALGLSPAQLAVAPEIMRKHILAIDGSAFQKTKSGNALPPVQVVDAEIVETTPNVTKEESKLAKKRTKKGTSDAAAT